MNARAAIPTPLTSTISRHAARSALRYAYAPLMLLGVNGAAIALVAAGAKLWLLPLLLGAVALAFIVERLIPYQFNWNRSQGDLGRDVAHAIVNEIANLGAVALLPAIASVVTISDLWPRRWPFALQVAAAVLVMDIGITLMHYASHTVPWLWRFHAVHHSVRRFYGLNGLMKHPVHQLIELTAGVTPLVLIGLPLDVATAMAACVAVQLLLQHSNADYRVGWLSRVLALNEGHRFHHLKGTAGDVNFGLFTTLWDRLLGTFVLDPRKRFTSEDLGIDANPDYPTAYVDQLAAPFRS